MITKNNRNNDDSKKHGTPIVIKVFVKSIPKKLRALVIGCLVLAWSGPLAMAQQDRGTVNVSGRISSALKLTVTGSQFHGLPTTNGWRATVEAQGRDFADIRLKREGQTSTSHITIPLEIRTNVAYRVKLSMVNSDGCGSSLRAYVDSPQAGGVRVASDAVASAHLMDIPDLAHTNAARDILTGTRVSMGGNFTTPSNALLVNLHLDILENQSACSGQPVIRVTLESSM